MESTTIDIRPEVHLADESQAKLDDMMRTLAFHVNNFDQNAAIFGVYNAWVEVRQAAGELWTEGLRDEL